MVISLARQEDLPDINRIYNQAVRQRFCTAHLEAIDMETREKWFHAHDPGRFPVFVAVDENKITGWVSLGAYREGGASATGPRNRVAGSDRGRGV